MLASDDAPAETEQFARTAVPSGQSQQDDM